jgi:hypothetical protein
VSSKTLDATLVIEGKLTSKSDQMPDAFGNDEDCTEASTTSTDVYAIELVGPGPHQLIVESWGEDPSLVNLFQNLDGTPDALDLDAPCQHWVALTDEWNGDGYRLVASGLAEGTVLIAPHSLLSSGQTREYAFRLTSSTSCSGSARSIEPGPDPASTRFVDPNPMTCTGSNLTHCEAGVLDSIGGEEATWTDCCLTDLIQNPDGKCGLSGNGSPCVERQQPGNEDPSCPTGDLVYKFPPNTLKGDGYPCCNWRTGLCGLMNPNDALDLGCSPIGPNGSVADQPCTPDYAAGIIF